MTWSELMRENGYETKTTFWMDFSIADRFGIEAIKDTFKRAFDEWKEHYEYLTEMVLVLNHKIWQHYKGNQEVASLYEQYWREANAYALEHLKDDELEYYISVTD